MLVASMLMAVSLKSANAFTSHSPTAPFRVRPFGQRHSVTPATYLLRVSKSSTTEKPTTTTSDSLPFFSKLPRGHAEQPPSVASKLQQRRLLSQADPVESVSESRTTNDNKVNPSLVLGAGVLGLVSLVSFFVTSYTDLSLADVTAWGHQLLEHPKETLEAGVDAVQAMGPAGVLVFGLIYCIAEILVVPATPLTLSAGYLFGLGQGTAIVLLAATCAACVAFGIGKTFLRTWVEEILGENPKFAKLDKAIGKEGFKLLLLVRLSPIFPFAVSNYLYGASSIDFASYFWGTLLGFAPGTLAYVYTGMVGKALTLGGGEGAEPWYVYAGGLAILAGFVKLASDVAAGIIETIDDQDEELLQ